MTAVGVGLERQGGRPGIMERGALLREPAHAANRRGPRNTVPSWTMFGAQDATSTPTAIPGQSRIDLWREARLHPGPKRAAHKGRSFRQPFSARRWSIARSTYRRNACGNDKSSALWLEKYGQLADPRLLASLIPR